MPDPKFIKPLIAVLLVLVAFLFRTIWHIAPNVEFVTTASLLAATFLGRKYAVMVPLATMFVSDAVIGNNSIFIFTWSAYIFIGLGGLMLRSLKSHPKKLILASSFQSLASAVFFYLYTNFGVWLLWRGMYPKTLGGLLDCYLMGLPFLKLNLLGNLFLTPLGFAISTFAISPTRDWSKRLSLALEA